MDTLIVAGGEINSEILSQCIKEHKRTKYYCCR